MIHGERRCYQAGCRCRPCRRANADYAVALRTLRARGHQPLGSRISARRFWRLVDRLRREGFSQAELARRLGLKRPILEISHQAVTVRTVARLARLYRQVCDEPEPPHPCEAS